MIFTIYITVVFSSLILAITDFILKKIGIINHPDIFKLLNDLYDQLQEIENEKIRETIMNIIDSLISNPINSIILLLILSVTPILNVGYLIIQISCLKNELVKRRNEQ